MELAPALTPVTPESGLGCTEHPGIGHFVDWREEDTWQIRKGTDRLDGWGKNGISFVFIQDSET